MVQRIGVFTAVVFLFLSTPAWSDEAPQGPPGLQTATSEFVDVKWRQVSKGVWQAKDAEGAILTYASGKPGMKFALAELETELVEMSTAVVKDPQGDHLGDMEVLLGTMGQMKSDIEGNALGEITDISKATTSCWYNYVLTTGASPSIQGASALAESWWQISYFGCIGTAYARSSATVTLTNGPTLSAYDSCSKTDYLALCETYVNVFGDGTCRSSAYAYVYSSAAGIFFSKWSENCNCGYFGPGC